MSPLSLYLSHLYISYFELKFNNIKQKVKNCHNNPWVSCAETVVGHGDRALEIYQKTCPAYIEDKIKADLSGMNAFRRGPLFKSMLNLQLRSFILVIFSYKSSFLRESSFIHRALCCRCTKCRPGPDILTFA